MHDIHRCTWWNAELNQFGVFRSKECKNREISLRVNIKVCFVKKENQDLPEVRDRSEHVQSNN